jgi:hypothetical protein
MIDRKNREEGERGQTGNIVHVLVDYNVHAALGISVCRYVGDGEGFRHLGSLLVSILRSQWIRNRGEICC